MHNLARRFGGVFLALGPVGIFAAACAVAMASGALSPTRAAAQQRGPMKAGTRVSAPPPGSSGTSAPKSGGGITPLAGGGGGGAGCTSGSHTTITVCPKTDTIWENTANRAINFTVTNSSVAGESYDIDPCTYSGAVTACSTFSFIDVPANSSRTLTVYYSSGTVLGSGTVNVNIHSIYDAGETASTRINATVRTNAMVTVTPDAAAMGASPASDSTKVFTVKNIGTVSGTFNLTPTCADGAGAGACTVAPTSLTLGVNATGTTTASFRSGLGGAEGRVTVKAVYASDARVLDTGWVNVSVAGVQVTLAGGPTQLAVNGSATYSFRVKNIGSQSGAFTFTCATSGLAGCSAATPTSATLYGGLDTLVTAVATASAVGGPATVTLEVGGPGTGFATQNVTVTGMPRLSVAYTAGSRVVRAACPTIGLGPQAAAQCGSLLFAHSFPGYRSMGKMRNVTLLYNSATVRPTPLVVIDYTTYAGQPLTQGLRAFVIRTSNGVRLTDTVYYSGAGFTTSYSALHRMVLPINADSVGLPTGMHPVRVYVQRKENNVWLAADTASTRLIVVNRERSPFGAGWWPAGVEKLILAQDACGGVLLVTADGSATYFSRACNGIFTSPPGERSKMYAVGNQFKRVLPGGRVTVWYDSTTGLVQSVTDNNPTPNTATYAWRSVGPDGPTIDSITDPAGRSIKFVSDAGGTVYLINIPGVTSPHLTMSGPDANNATRLLSIQDADGFTTPFTYDLTTYRMLNSTSRRFAQVNYFHNARIGVVDSVAGTGLVSPLYLTHWQMAGVPAAGTGTAGTPATSASPDSVRTVVTSRYSRGFQSYTVSTWFQVHATGAPSVVSSHASNTALLTFIDRDSIGQPTHITRQTGAEVWQMWDANGNLTRSIQRMPGGRSDPNTLTYDTTNYTYDPTSLSVTHVDPPDHRGELTMMYDMYGRDTLVTDTLGRKTRFYYTARGLLDSIVGPHPTIVGGREAIATKYVYDQTSFNVASVTSNAGTMSIAYDAAFKSDVLSATDALGGQTQFTYDALKRPVTVTQVAGTAPSSTITYRHSDATRTDSVLDPLGKAATSTFDQQGRLTSHCVRDSWCEGYRYLAYNGKVDTIITRNGKRISMDHDAAGNVVFKQVGNPDIYHPIGDDQVMYLYDDDGNGTSIVNRWAKITRSLDAYGRPTAEREDIRGYQSPNVWFGVEARHEYDRQGRRVRTYLSDQFTPVRVCTPAPDNLTCIHPFTYAAPVDTIRYHFDPFAGNLDTLDNSFWQITKGTGRRAWVYSSDLRGRVTDLKVPTTTVGTNDVHWDYGTDDQMTTQTNGSYGRPAEALTRDALGRVIRDATWQDNNYVFDGLGRLTERHATGGTITNEYYTYDQNSNRLSDGTWTYYYNDRGQLWYRASNGCTSMPTYDEDGNQISVMRSGLSPCVSQLSETAVFDAGDKMTSRTVYDINGRPESRAYWYDGLGRRIFMKSDSLPAQGVDPGDFGLWRYWWLDNQQVLKTYNLMLDSASLDLFGPKLARSGNTLTTDNKSGEWFFYGPGTDNQLGSYNCRCSTVGQQRLYFHDWRGSVNQITNQAGQDMNQAAPSFSPFGSAENAPAGAATQPGFNGQESSGGLVYMRNRWYDAGTGRFTQQDPIGYSGGLNLYGYAAADPVTLSDPLGLAVCFKETGRDTTKGGTEDAANAKITLDDNGCVTKVECHGKPTDLCVALQELVASPDTVTVRVTTFDCNTGSHRSCYDPATKTVHFHVADIGGKYAGDYFGCSLFDTAGPGGGSWTAGAIMAHELLGHADSHISGGSGLSEPIGISAENSYHASHNEGARCRSWIF